MPRRPRTAASAQRDVDDGTGRTGDRPSGESSPAAWLEALALLGDPLRIRLLRLLGMHELGVGELARIVQVPQSTVSRHLKPLFDANWIAKRSEGTASLYRLDDVALAAPLRSLWSLTLAQLQSSAAVIDDDHRLVQVLAERRADSARFFGRIGGDWSRLRGELFGENLTDGALLGLVDPEWTVADLGCGTGEATERLAPLVRRVIAVDRESSMLVAARKRLDGATNVEFRKGDLSDLPLTDGEADAAVLMLVLHHIDDVASALVESSRTLRRGGVLLIVDMVAHDREHWRHTMGHRHLGFTPEAVESWADHGDLTFQRLHRLRADTESKGPGLFCASFRKR